MFGILKKKLLKRKGIFYREKISFEKIFFSFYYFSTFSSIKFDFYFFNKIQKKLKY
jgi:hypothetical protein